MNEDMNAEHGSVGTMNDTGKSVADAATVAVIMTLAKLYQVVIITAASSAVSIKSPRER